MSKRVRRLLGAAAAALLLSFGMVFVATPSASAASGTISGDVQCFFGDNFVAGIWVDADYGTDGWATTSSDGMGGKYYSYHLSNPSGYILHVGCGTNWVATMYTPHVDDSYYDWVCSYSTSYGFYCAES